MKMKWKSVLLAMCVGMGAFTSCSDDDNVDPNGGGDGTGGTGEVGYVSFSTSTRPGAITKAKTDVGETEEGIVTSGFVAFYSVDTNGDPTTVKLYRDLDDLSNVTGTFKGDSVAENPGLPNSGDRFTMSAVILEKNDYKLLVVLNPTQAMRDAAAKGQPYSAFATVQDETVANLSATTSTDVLTKIAMSNSRNLVRIVKTQFKDSEEKAEQADDIPMVGVDRILAKVKFDRAANIDYPRGGQLGDAKWALDITNKKTYWMRQQTYVAPQQVLANPSAWATMEGLFTDRDLLYAKDPNPANSQQLAGPMTPTAAQKEHFNYLTSASEITIDLKDSGASRQYVLENTMEADHQYEDVTTRIVMHANFRPEKVGGGTFDAGESYYYFRGVALSHTEIYEMYQDLPNNEDHPWPDYPAGLKDAVEYIMDPANRPVGSDNAKFDFNSPNPPAESVASSGNALTFYKDGMSFYSILIRHFDDTLSPGLMNYGRYGVVRNNVYNVTLNRVNGPGTPNIPDPEGPDDKEDIYISAEISVLPWVVRDQNVGI